MNEMVFQSSVAHTPRRLPVCLPVVIVLVMSVVVIARVQVTFKEELNSLKHEIQMLKSYCHNDEKGKAPLFHKDIRQKRAIENRTEGFMNTTQIVMSLLNETGINNTKTNLNISEIAENIRRLTNQADNTEKFRRATKVKRTRTKKARRTTHPSLLTGDQACSCQGEIDKYEKRRRARSYSAHFSAFVDEARLARTPLNDSSRLGTFDNGAFIPEDKILRFWKAKSFNDKRLYNYIPDTGKLEIRRKGVYMVYAQVVFHDSAARKSIGLYQSPGHVVVPLLESISFDVIRSRRDLAARPADEMTAGQPRSRRHNKLYSQCDLVGVISARKGDQIYIKSSEDNRGMLPKEYLSYWGITRVN